jgi:hypothetical protein
MMADIVHRPLEPQHEVSARVDCRKSADLQRVEHAKDVEFSFLRRFAPSAKTAKETCMAEISRRAPALASFQRMVEREEHSTFGKTDALLILMATIWAVNFSVIKYATGVLSPLAFTGLRVAIAAAVLLAIAFLQGKRWPPKADILTLIMLGVIGNGVYQILFVEGLSRTKVGNAVLIVAASPAFVAIASRLKGIERVRHRHPRPAWRCRFAELPSWFMAVQGATTRPRLSSAHCSCSLAY